MHAYRPNHYEELGVERNADAEAIRTAYRALAKQLHPDLSDDAGNEASEAFLRLQEAYDVLRDPERRAQYDGELGRLAAMAQAARSAARRPIPPRAAPIMAPAATSRRQLARRLGGVPGYLAAIGLVVIVTAGIATWQLLLPPEPQLIVVARAHPDNPGRPVRSGGAVGPEQPHDPGILTKEVDRAVQLQVERVEAAKKRLQTQLSELDARKPSSESSAPRKAPSLAVSRVECIGRGTSIVLTRDKDSAKISYDNGPEVQPRISEVGTTILVSRIEPTNKVAIAFTRGDRSGTTLLMFDQAGSVQQTFNVECTVAAF